MAGTETLTSQVSEYQRRFIISVCMHLNSMLSEMEFKFERTPTNDFPTNCEFLCNVNSIRDISSVICTCVPTKCH